MKKLTALLTIAALVLQAQTTDTVTEPVPTDQNPEDAAATIPEQVPTSQPVGSAAIVATTETVQNYHWQNWTFFATAVITATAAILIVSTNRGKEAHD